MRRLAAPWRHRVGRTRTRRGESAVADERRGSRAWAVLAVALALMALVTALTSTPGRSSPAVLERPARGAAPAPRTRRDGADLPGGRGRGSGSGAHTARRAPRVTRRLGSESFVGEPARNVPRAADAVVTGVSAQAAFASARRAAGLTPSPPHAAGAGGAGTTGSGTIESTRSWSPATVPEASTARSTPPSPTGGSGSPPAIGAATGSFAGPYPGHTSIEAPATSVSFAARGGGAVSARAVWTGTPDLELGISCAGGVSATRMGPSGLSLEVDDAQGGGSCSVTVSLPPGVPAGVSFTLVVYPAP